MSPAALSGVALMGRTLVLHVPLFSPVARPPALLVFTCSPWKRAAKDHLLYGKNGGFERNPNFCSLLLLGSLFFLSPPEGGLDLVTNRKVFFFWRIRACDFQRVIRPRPALLRCPVVGCSAPSLFFMQRTRLRLGATFLRPRLRT